MYYLIILYIYLPNGLSEFFQNSVSEQLAIVYY